MDLLTYGSYVSHGARNACSFGYGMAKGFTHHLMPALYIFGMTQGGRALGYTGLTANTLSAGLGTIDTAKSIVDLTRNVQKMSLASNRSDYLKIAQNVHQIAISLAMVHNVFNPTPLTDTLISVELLRRGWMMAMKGVTEFQENLDLSKKRKYDWTGMGESLMTTLWGVNSCVGGLSKFFHSFVWKQEKPQMEILGTTSGRHAVALTASWDHNGVLVFHNWKRYFGPISDLQKNYTVYSSVVKNHQEACNILEDARKTAGKLLDVAYIHAHGNRYGIILGEGQLIDTVNVEKISECLKQNLSKDAPIFLASCRTAQPRSGDRLNFAERLAGETGHSVFASVLKSGYEECRIRDDVYSCALYPGEEDYPEEMKSIQGLSTSHPREYNRLIQRSKDEKDEFTIQNDWLYTQFIEKMTMLVPQNVWKDLAKTRLWQEMKKRIESNTS